MKILLLTILTCSLLYSCGSNKKLEVSQIKSLYFDYNQIERNNYGNTINGKFTAQLIDGTEFDVSKDKNFLLSSSDVVWNESKGQLFISKKPLDFEDNSLNISVAYKDKEDEFIQNQKIELNLLGDLIIAMDGVHGVDGIDKKDRSGRILLKDGKYVSTIRQQDDIKRSLKKIKKFL